MLVRETADNLGHLGSDVGRDRCPAALWLAELPQGGARGEAEAAGRVLMNQGTEAPARPWPGSQGSRVLGTVVWVLTFAMDV